MSLKRIRGLELIGADLSPLRESPQFRTLWTTQAVSAAGQQITAVALPLQIYLATRSTLAVGLLGAVRLIPLLATSLAAGVLADRFDRRLIMIASNVGSAACAVALCLSAILTFPIVGVFAVAALMTIFGSVAQPARQATIPNLVSKEALPSAMVLNLALFHLLSTSGPIAGGLVIGGFGLSAAYAIDAITYLVSAIMLLKISRQTPARVGADSPIQSLKEGLTFVRTNQLILGSFCFDLDAMVFGLPRTLFPVLALTRFHGGAVTLGLLYAAPSIGGVVAMLTSGWLKRFAHLGRVFIVGELIWGAAIAAAGFSPTLVPVLGFLALAGAADAYGVVGRSTIMQLATPDRLRGRVAAAYAMAVGGGPNLGDFESGAVAQAFSPEVSFISGGLMCAVLVAAMVPIFPAMWKFGTAGR